MKRTLIGAFALLLAAGAVSCSSSKKASGPAAPAGMVEEAIPLSGAQYRSNAEYYRAVQNGVSTERSTAQKIAMQNCRQDLAAAIQADVKLVIENYVKNQDTGVAAEHKSQYQELAYTADRTPAARRGRLQRNVRGARLDKPRNRRGGRTQGKHRIREFRRREGLRSRFYIAL